MSLDLDFILNATGGKIIQKKQTSFSAVGTDTRKNLKDQIFIALAGESYDAHSFLAQAVQSAASALLVHRWDGSVVTDVTVILVEDTLKALQDLGHAVRRKNKALVIGITGSNGKTTSKEFSAQLISASRKVSYSRGSFNNHWGVPMTLLEVPSDAEVSLVEMGMNHAGEIQRLCQIAQPDVVVCTMVGRAHIEHFGSIEKIAEAKSEIYQFSPANNLKIYNLDDPQTWKMWNHWTQNHGSDKVLTFSQKDPSANVYLRLLDETMGSLSVEGHIQGCSGKMIIHLIGRQNMTNIMVAICNALAVGISAEKIWKDLVHLKTHWGRNQIVQRQDQGKILFDAYNANPDSMKALILNLQSWKSAKQQGQRWVGIFGEMLEMGEASSQLHQELGALVATAGFDQVYFQGKQGAAFEKGLLQQGYAGRLQLAESFDQKLAESIAQQLRPDDFLVLKGSRGMKLERYVNLIPTKDFGSKDA
jgi:UDP-N-acetylmuramoyl-tripeptide--D-alanyl-D-alanine ligase